MTEKCTVCEKDIVKTTYVPMDEWKIKGKICSKCYYAERLFDIRLINITALVKECNMRTFLLIKL